MDMDTPIDQTQMGLPRAVSQGLFGPDAAMVFDGEFNRIDPDHNSFTSSVPGKPISGIWRARASLGYDLPSRSRRRNPLQ